MSLTWGNCVLGLSAYDILVVFYLATLRRLRLSCLVHPLNGLLLFGYLLRCGFMYVYKAPRGCSWCYFSAVIHTTRGAAYTKGHRDAATRRQKDSIFKILKLRTMTTYIKEYYWQKRALCSRFHQNVLSEDGPVGPQHVARNRIYSNGILVTF
jgi:hypothetical protein